MHCADSAEFAPNSTYSRRSPTERGVDFPAPSTQGVDRAGRLRVTVLVINFTHVDPGLDTALDFLRLVRASHGFRRPDDRVKKSARAHEIGRIDMRPPDGASSRHEVGPRTALLSTKRMHIPNDCAVPSVAHLPATAGVDEAVASGRAPASISNPSCAPADVNGMGRHQTQDANARIASLRPSTSACGRGPRRRSCRASRSSCALLAGCGRHVDSHSAGAATGNRCAGMRWPASFASGSQNRSERICRSRRFPPGR